jgi:prepilin-type N-terminal cleavage/methylation domain-containing protein
MNKEKLKTNNLEPTTMTTSKGFTLVEVLVSVAIFTLTMLIATGAVFTIVDANKKSHNLKSVMTNLNFALETMMRDMRVGSSYVCIATGGNCPNGGDGVSFTSNMDRDSIGGNDTAEYTFVEDSNGMGGIYRWRQCNISFPGCDASAIRITAQEIDIEDMKFYVVGASTGDGQPRVLIKISGYVGVGTTKSTFNIQTTVSQRVIDPS